MYFHLIPLQELKRHSVTYWQPGRDRDVNDDTWVVIAERGSGLVATILDAPAPDSTSAAAGERIHRPSSQTPDISRDKRAEDVLALFLADLNRAVPNRLAQ